MAIDDRTYEQSNDGMVLKCLSAPLTTRIVYNLQPTKGTSDGRNGLKSNYKCIHLTEYKIPMPKP